MRYCPNCGAEVAADAKFCTKCGAKLNEAVSPQQPVAAAPVQSARTVPIKSHQIPVWAIVVAALVVLVGGGIWYHQTHLPLLNNAGDAVSRSVSAAVEPQTPDDTDSLLTNYDARKLPSTTKGIMVFEFVPDHTCYMLAYEPNNQGTVAAFNYRIKDGKITLNRAGRRSFNFNVTSLADLAKNRGFFDIGSSTSDEDDDEDVLEFGIEKGAITNIWTFENEQRETMYHIIQPLKLNTTASVRLSAESVYRALVTLYQNQN